jgi:hypothetical protein
MEEDEPKIKLTEDMKLYRKQYYEQNKSKSVPKVCKICGTKYQQYNKSNHTKTQKHIRAIETYNLKLQIEELNKLNEVKQLTVEKNKFN